MKRETASKEMNLSEGKRLRRRSLHKRSPLCLRCEEEKEPKKGDRMEATVLDSLYEGELMLEIIGRRGQLGL